MGYLPGLCVADAVCFCLTMLWLERTDVPGTLTSPYLRCDCSVSATASDFDATTVTNDEHRQSLHGQQLFYTPASLKLTTNTAAVTTQVRARRALSGRDSCQPDHTTRQLLV